MRLGIRFILVLIISVHMSIVEFAADDSSDPVTLSAADQDSPTRDLCQGVIGAIYGLNCCFNVIKHEGKVPTQKLQFCVQEAQGVVNRLEASGQMSGVGLLAQELAKRYSLLSEQIITAQSYLGS